MLREAVTGAGDPSSSFEEGGKGSASAAGDPTPVRAPAQQASSGAGATLSSGSALEARPAEVLGAAACGAPLEEARAQFGVGARRSDLVAIVQSWTSSHGEARDPVAVEQARLEADVEQLRAHAQSALCQLQRAEDNASQH